MDVTATRPDESLAENVHQAVLPELRDAWWETGARRRAGTALTGVFAELPSLVRHAVLVAWRADRLRTVLIGVATIGGGVLSTFGLLSTQQVLVELFGNGPTADRVRAAFPALVLLGCIAAVRGTLAIVTGYAQIGLAPRVKQTTERRYFEATTGVRLEAFDGDAFADDMERAKTCGEDVNELVRGTADTLAGLVNLLAVGVAVLVINPLLLLALVVATLPKAYAALRSGHLRYAHFLAGSVRRRRLWVLHHQMAERKSAAELRSYGLRGFLLKQYDMVMRIQTVEELRLARRVTVNTAVGTMIGGIGLAGVWVLLGVLLATGRIPLSAAVTCVVAVQAAQAGLMAMTWQIERVYNEGQYVRDYLTFLERAGHHLPATPMTQDDEEPRPHPGPLRQLEVRGVSLQYPDRHSPAVDRVTFTVTAGETIALVGENGSGKSTLAAMIAGLRRPTGGVLHWNGKPYDDWDPELLRARTGVVLQEHHRWPYSAAANIAMGAIDAPPDRARIELAARRALAHEMVLDLPHGYDTLLDRTFKDGQDLSGGQWQRITAARGFYRDADLLIMDEPSSALDPRAEDALFQDLRARQGVLTTILVTHRLANVMHADRIFVMHEGVVTETGTHAQLMALRGRYCELFSLQASGYRADEP
ncbi:ABC transporter ATP-binding protein [Kineosporia sp. J2-2]|uniref:ABC transporter ATP-binding protein n=1 Tax=Kineosporia corallincola TaxID=2835133 RepID=A0ABS5TES1_9ACTN|nr:ABC transporter ATP-binding protein [Kineosporia corallincola]MBT0769551.1 ABC transporter ATP-binding protein [Kineosporia corallincola]